MLLIKLSEQPSNMSDVHSVNGTASGAAVAAVVAGSKDTILLLEDNEAIANLISTVLTRVGLRVIWCASAVAGMKEFKAQPQAFALVISDCRLPDGDGRLVCQQMRSIVASLPVLLTSGRIRTDNLAPLEAGKNVQFLPKPYAPSEIVTRVRQMLGLAPPPRKPASAGFV